MKVVNRIALASAALVLFALEASAQTSSSTSQVVTFGVRRTQPAVLASAQSSSISVTESGVERATPLKIAVGSGSRSNLFAEGVDKKSLRSRSFAYNVFAPMVDSGTRLLEGPQTSSSVMTTRDIKSASPDRFVVTLTE